MSGCVPLAVLLSCLAMFVFAESAWATDQVPEQIVVEGRVQRMARTPLSQWLRQQEKAPWSQRLGSTSCWRGHVGRWLLERDQLFLLSLEHFDLKGWAKLPLKQHFGTDAPVPATWFSGNLSLPLGNAVGRGRKPRDVAFAKTLHVEIVDGRVMSKRVVDHHVGNALTRSFLDLERVGQASADATDGGAWHDARLIATEAFQKQVRAGTAFRTRGFLMGEKGTSLYIPKTAIVAGTSFSLEGTPPVAPGPMAFPPVEIEAVWKLDGKWTVLTVSKVRKLKAHESIHHPAFPSPLNAQALARLALAKQAYDIKTERRRDARFGSRARMEGMLVGGDYPAVVGVDVAADDTLAGKPVFAIGILEQWVVTGHLLDTNQAVAKWVGTRGPGTYFRLVDPFSGVLAKPQAQ